MLNPSSGVPGQKAWPTGDGRPAGAARADNPAQAAAGSQGHRAVGNPAQAAAGSQGHRASGNPAQAAAGRRAERDARGLLSLDGRPLTSLGSASYLRVAALPERELEAIMRRGEPPDPAAMAGWEFRGTNTPAWARLVGIKKFIKGFYQDPSGTVWGYNEPAVQNALDQPWMAQPSDAAPKRFGFFLVAPVDPTARDNAYLNAVLLDYGRGKNPALEPSQVLRDYLVRVERGSDELLLGKAYLALGPARLATSYFVLERHWPTDWTR